MLPYRSDPANAKGVSLVYDEDRAFDLERARLADHIHLQAVHSLRSLSCVSKVGEAES